MSVRLVDIASVIRSKNSGPGRLTLDIIFRNAEWFEKVMAAQAINKTVIARLYGYTEADIDSIIPFPPASAIKITMPRRLVSGDVGDSDIYGAQQHAPLLNLELLSPLLVMGVGDSPLQPVDSPTPIPLAIMDSKRELH